MIIRVGSTNPAKIDAVKDIRCEYSLLRNATVEGVKVDSGISHEPIGFKEIIFGARNRSLEVFKVSQTDMGIGIESGLLEVEESRAGLVNICVVNINYLGKNHLGLSGGYELTEKQAELVRRGMSLSEACKALGLSTDTGLGSREGYAGVLTNGRATRRTLAHEALKFAMSYIENPYLLKL